MSKYSSHISQFLDYTLAPAMNKYSVRLAAIESEGYDGVAIRALRKKLFLLLPVYDFLQDYVDGEEECEFTVLTDLVAITGLEVLAFTKATI